MDLSARRWTMMSAVAVLLMAAIPARGAVIELHPTEAFADEFAIFSGGHAFWLKGLFDPPGLEDPSVRKYVFDSQATLRIVEDNTIDFFGSVVSDGDPARTFNFDVDFVRVDQDSEEAKRELIDEAYIEFDEDPGIDPEEWSFWMLDMGALTGTGAMTGTILDLQQRGPAFQLGDGASGKNILFGFSGWLGWDLRPALAPTVLNGDTPRSHGIGDININSNGMPVPPTLALLGLGLIGAGLVRRSRRRDPKEE